MSADREKEPRRSRADLEQIIQFCLADAALIELKGFRVRHTPNLPSPMAFGHKERTVLINPEHFNDKFTPEEIRYIFAHELGHLQQLLNHQELYEGVFTDAKARAHKQPSAVRGQVEKLWLRFYNVFLDMSANALVDANNPWTQQNTLDEHPRRKLYAREDMFPSDLTAAPRTEQFLFALLRRVMLGPGTVTHVDEVVSQMLNKPIMRTGKEYPDAFALAEAKFFNHRIAFDIQVGYMRTVFAPMFEELINLDVSEHEDDEKHINNANRPVDADGDDLNPEHVKAVKETLEKIEKSPEENVKDADRKRFRANMAAGGFTPSDIETAENIREGIGDLYRVLMDLWEVFTHLDTAEHQVEVGRQRDGKSVEVSELLRQLPQLLADPSQLRIFTRRFIENESIIRPQTIDLYFALDLSNSMDAEKRRAVQECVYVIVKSLVQFSRQQEFLTQADQSPVKFKLRLLGFGSETEDLFEITQADREAGVTLDTDDLDARIWKAILAIGTKKLGGTYDAPALEIIHRDLLLTERDLTGEDRVSVVFEVTDGISETPDGTRELVETFAGIGGNVHARAIQIGSPVASANEHPHDVFQSIWGDKGAKLPDVTQLREVLLRLLFEALRTNKAD